MIITKFKAQGFRNIESCSIEFSPGVNLLHGDNAQGKTNALEGIYIFARGKSFRKAEEKELKKRDSIGFRLEIEYEDRIGKNKLEYSLLGKERKRKKNGYQIKSASEMVGSFRAVLFFPDDLSIVKGSPDERREFLNVSIAQCYPEYINYYKKYKVAQENRNQILKNASRGLYFDEGELSSWSDTLAEYSSYIYIMRRDYIKKLELYAKDIILDFSEGKEELSFFYKSNIFENEDRKKERKEVEEDYRRIYKEEIEREKAVGSGLFGPSRDDIVISIGGYDTRSFASQGQQRSIVLSMKLAEGEIIKEIYGEYPVYLFDDVLSELDEKRQKYVLLGKPGRQIIISSCERENKAILPDKIIEVRGGAFE